MQATPRPGPSDRPVRAQRPSVHPIPAYVAHRALTKCVYDPETGCHISTYSVGSHGYAQIGWQVGEGRNAGTTAHRAAWTAVYGHIPAGQTIDHICNNRRCVNPAHLRMLSNLENARRTQNRDWPVGVCANGHDNQFMTESASGKMTCSICRQTWNQRYNQKRGA